MWTLKEGIQVARLTNDLTKSFGYSVSLGGSVLMTGKSKKDLDLILMPYKTSNPTSIKSIFLALSTLGFNNFQRRDHTKVGDEKLVYKCIILKRRVDFFFVS